MASLLQDPVRPDVKALRQWIIERTPANRPFIVELFQDYPVQQAIAERYDLWVGLDLQTPADALEAQVRLQGFLGYDMIRIQSRVAMPFFRATAVDPVADGETGPPRVRSWQDEHHGPIHSWETFEQFPWPRIEDFDFSPFEWAERNLPENMGVYTLTAHILEFATWLMGYETLCLKLYDEPDLVEALFHRIGELSDAYSRAVCDFERLAVLWGSDDMGFKGGTMISAEHLRRLVLPWHASSARIAHEHGKMYWLHSCGNLEEIMPDIIDTVGVDAKHSFEDVILPIEEVSQRYGSRIGILGGVDVDFLCRADEPAIRHRVRAILDECIPRGGFCLGSGNSVANYIPLDNYLIMLDEGRRYFA